LIAIGGGVCLDVVGLAANLYRRNTPVIKVRLVPAADEIDMMINGQFLIEGLRVSEA
jgi:hypothetical protein